ncbi:MAG TPA: FAD-dependent oxidoreductase [Stellaceae bacterium]|nr:FAD-dependent oxidoreductase [Stellaceae bacterium]
MTVDFLVIGGGMAGASAAYFLAERGRVLLLEREDAPGYHTTGRSAAMYTQNYGTPVVRALAQASGDFLRRPPAGFSESPLMQPRGFLTVAPPGQESRLEQSSADARREIPTMRIVDRKETLALCPLLKPEVVGAALYEPDATDLDVHAIHQGFLRGFRGRGGTVVTGAEVRSLERRNDIWEVETPAGRFSAPVAVNAAGAWADEIARLAGARPIGLVPKRRTAFTVDPPAGVDPAPWPFLDDFRELVYFKPEAGRLLVSPMDETPSPPCDAQPEELDVAEAVARLEDVARIAVKRVVRKWAGLRSFVSDKTPVVGPAPEAPGYIWLAGQGGFGIMTSPAMGRLATAMATGDAFPSELSALGVRPEQLLPGRLLA